MAVVAARPSPSDRIAATVNDGERRKERAEKRTSAAKSRSHRGNQISRTASRTWAPPNAEQVEQPLHGLLPFIEDESDSNGQITPALLLRFELLLTGAC